MLNISPYSFPGLVWRNSEGENTRFCDPSTSLHRLYQILHVVAIYYDIPEDLIRSTNRKVEYSLPRQMFCHLTMKYTRISTTTIALFLNHTNHATVSKSRKKIEGYMKYDDEIKRDFLLLQAYLKNIF